MWFWHFLHPRAWSGFFVLCKKKEKSFNENHSGKNLRCLLWTFATKSRKLEPRLLEVFRSNRILINFFLSGFLWHSGLSLFLFNVQSNLSLRPPGKSDHLKIVDTQFQSLHFADSNVRSVFLKMQPPEKCEMRRPKVGPGGQFNLQKATTYVQLSEKHFFDYLTFPSQTFRTSDHCVSKFRLVWSLFTPCLHVGTTDRWYDAMACAGAMCTTPYWKILNQTWQMRPPKK